MYHPEMAKEATNPNKNTRKRTFEYVGTEKQTAEEVRFRHLSHTKLLTSITYKLKQLL